MVGVHVTCFEHGLCLANAIPDAETCKERHGDHDTNLAIILERYPHRVDAIMPAGPALDCKVTVPVTGAAMLAPKIVMIELGVTPELVNPEGIKL